MNRATRAFDLKRMLNDRRRAVLSDSGPALVLARRQMVARIDDALVRLDGGKYGSCLECAREISEQRLSAVPFAVHCQACEEQRQQEPTP
jgi:RNA polymerase-binding transcription factor DksA